LRDVNQNLATYCQVLLSTNPERGKELSALIQNLYNLSDEVLLSSKEFEKFAIDDRLSFEISAMSFKNFRKTVRKIP